MGERTTDEINPHRYQISVLSRSLSKSPRGSLSTYPPAFLIITPLSQATNTIYYLTYFLHIRVRAFKLDIFQMFRISLSIFLKTDFSQVIFFVEKVSPVTNLFLSFKLNKAALRFEVAECNDRNYKLLKLKIINKLY